MKEKIWTYKKKGGRKSANKFLNKFLCQVYENMVFLYKIKVRKIKNIENSRKMIKILKKS